MNIKLKLVFIILVVPNVCSNNIYCGLPQCPGGSHTLCKYQLDTLADRCGEGEPYTLFDHVQNNIAAVQLLLREGTVNRWRLIIGASNHTTELTWNKILARAARKWANQCEQRLDQCRHVAQYSVDQRISRCRIYNGIVQPSFTEVIQQWYNIDPLVLEDRGEMRQNSGIRSLWETATEFGCAATISNNFYVYFVCNFGPVEYEVYFDPRYQDYNLSIQKYRNKTIYNYMFVNLFNLLNLRKKNSLL